MFPQRPGSPGPEALTRCGHSSMLHSLLQTVLTVLVVALCLHLGLTCTAIPSLGITADGQCVCVCVCVCVLTCSVAVQGEAHDQPVRVEVLGILVQL